MYSLNTLKAAHGEVEFSDKLHVSFYNNDIEYRVYTTYIAISAKYAKPFDKVRNTETCFSKKKYIFFLEFSTVFTSFIIDRNVRKTYLLYNIS